MTQTEVTPDLQKEQSLTILLEKMLNKKIVDVLGDIEKLETTERLRLIDFSAGLSGEEEPELAVNQQLLSNYKILLKRYKSALDKVKDGTFGSCEQCGETILPGRLELVPFTPHCTDCASAAEKEKEKGKKR